MEPNIRFVMVQTTHPGNIGAAARAMKNMCLRQLVLVRPGEFPSEEAAARASGADDILRSARVTDSLAEAVAELLGPVTRSARRGQPVASRGSEEMRNSMMRNLLGIALAGLLALGVAGSAGAATLSYSGTLTFGLLLVQGPRVQFDRAPNMV